MNETSIRRIHVIDSHTGGEPTRVVIDGAPDLGRGSMAERRALLRERHDWLRSAVINEPRGSDVLVGALLCEPVDPSCVAGVIYFNNVGTIGMCGHGTIGVAVTLAHLGRIGAGTHKLETPVGVVSFDYSGGNEVTIKNVPSYRYAANVTVAVEGIGKVTGDVAWGGNWFFLVSQHSSLVFCQDRIDGLKKGGQGSRRAEGVRQEPHSPTGQSSLDGTLTPWGCLELSNVERLTDFTWRIRQSLAQHGITGADGHEIDHVELFGPPQNSTAHSRNFVLCPGKAYDRSPCGTGTSAKIACLIADGKLQPGEVWRQESIVGSVFEGWATIEGDKVIPHIKGSAYITAEATLILNPADPFCYGIR